MEEFVYALALQYVKGIGPINAKRIIENFGSAKKVYEAFCENPTKLGCSQKIIAQLFLKSHLEKAQYQLKKAASKGINCLYFLNEDYPSVLLENPDAPLLMFYDGDLKVLNNKRVLSIVGTRNMTNYGRSFCSDLISGIQKYNPLIVSGFAYGVDICAHLEAVKYNVPTIAVLAHGFDMIYPKDHKQHYVSVLGNGGFLTEFMFEEQPLRENFLKRNRIVAGISQATLVIESAAKGGALVTADIAGSYNKDVFAVPGRTVDKFSKGCNDLIRQNKAAMITSVEDLIFELGWELPTNTKTVIQPSLFVSLEGEEQLLYNLLLNEIPKHVDEISRSLGIPIYKVSNILFNLEMKGLIKILPGKMVTVSDFS